MFLCRRIVVVWLALAVLAAPVGVAWASASLPAAAGAEGAAGMHHCDAAKAPQGMGDAGCCTPDSGCVPETCAAHCLTPFNPPVAVQGVPDFQPVALYRPEPRQPPAWATGLLSPPPRS